MLSITCPHCHKTSSAPEEVRGKAVSCSYCRRPFKVAALAGVAKTTDGWDAAAASKAPPIAEPADGALAPVKIAAPPRPAAPMPLKAAAADGAFAIRVVAWVVCGILSLSSYCNYQGTIHSSRWDVDGRRIEATVLQQSGAAGEALVYIATACVIAFAIDRCTRR
jgi:hypothetical protein